jgi:hypothetical protein
VTFWSHVNPRHFHGRPIHRCARQVIAVASSRLSCARRWESSRDRRARARARRTSAACPALLIQFGHSRNGSSSAHYRRRRFRTRRTVQWVMARMPWCSMMIGVVRSGDVADIGHRGSVICSVGCCTLRLAPTGDECKATHDDGENAAPGSHHYLFLNQLTWREPQSPSGGFAPAATSA